MNYETLSKYAINWIVDWFNKNGSDKKAVLGISGGVKSTVTLALLINALGKERVVGVIMRDDKDMNLDNDAIDVCKYFGIQYYNIPVFPEINALRNLLNLNGKLKLTEQSVKNIPARMRMVTLYSVSQSINGFVINTSCLSDNYIGNVTHFGDSCGDMSPLGMLTLEEVIGIGTELAVPQRMLFTPADDKLPASKPDEERLGFSYVELDKYIRCGTIENVKHQEIIDDLYKRNIFKRINIKTFDPELYIHIPL